MAEKIDFQPLITSSTRDFTGREWLQQEFERFLQEEQGSYFLLSGEPGIGKTTFAAHLVARSSLPHHFISAQSVQWRNPMNFIRSLSAQLAERYGEGILDDARRLAQVKVTLNAGSVGAGASVVGVHVDEFVATPVEDEFLRLVLEPMEGLAAKGGAPPVLVIDGLDEAVSYTARPAIHQLAAHLGALQGVRLLMTCASGPALDELRRLLPETNGLHHRLEGSDPHNLADCRAYLERAVVREPLAGRLQSSGVAPVTFIESALLRSEGNFLYLTALLHAAGGGALDLKALPQEIGRLYLAALNGLVNNDLTRWHTLYAPLLGLLAVARQPLDEAHLSSFTGLEGGVVRQALRELGGLLEFDAALPATRRQYRLYHSALGNFLLDPDASEEFWLDAAQQHRRIAAFFLDQFPDPAQLTDDYACSNLAHHTRQSGADFLPRLFGLITPAVRQARRTRLQSDFVFSQDLAEAIGAAVEQPAPQGLPQLVRCALVDATLVSIVTSAPSHLLRGLAQAGQWQRAEALALTGGKDNLEGLAAVVHGLLDAGGVQNLESASVLAARLMPEGDQSEVVSRLCTRLGERLLPTGQAQAAEQAFARAEQAALSCPGADQRARSLAYLGRTRLASQPEPAKVNFDQALEFARAMPAELDALTAEFATAANLASQTPMEASWVRQKGVFDAVGAKARTLADVAFELAAAGDGRAGQVFQEAEALITQIGEGDMQAAFSEHTREHLAARRAGAQSGAFSDEQPAAFNTLELEASLQALEQPPSDHKGLFAQALLSLASQLVVENPVQAAEILSQAEAAAGEARGGYLARLLVAFAGLRRKLGQENAAQRLEERAQEAAIESSDLPALYRSWLAERGRQTAVSLRAAASTRHGLFKEAFISDRALADMTASLANEVIERGADGEEQLADALRLAERINDPSQRSRALAAIAAASPAERSAELVNQILQIGQSEDNFDFILLEAQRVLGGKQPEAARRLQAAIKAPDLKVLALVELAEALAAAEATPLLDQAWQAAQVLTQGSETLSSALARLAAVWLAQGDGRAAQVFTRALKAAHDEPSPPKSIDGLLNIAAAMLPRLPGPARETLEEASRLAPNLDGIRACGRALSNTAALWMEVEPRRAFQLLADLRRFGIGNFLDGLAQAVPPAARRFGAPLAWELYQAVLQARQFFVLE